jgi:hypothetical protein
MLISHNHHQQQQQQQQMQHTRHKKRTTTSNNDSSGNANDGSSGHGQPARAKEVTMWARQAAVTMQGVRRQRPMRARANYNTNTSKQRNGGIVLLCDAPRNLQF